MDNSSNAPRSLILSTRLYRALLTVYPSEFRRAYGGLMLQVFRDCSLRALKESGATGLLTLWSRTMLDTVKTALEEHTQRGVDMSREKFIKLSGWGMILAAVALLSSFLPEADQIMDGLYQTFGVPATSARYDLYQRLSTGIRGLPFPSAILLITIGLLGLRARYGKQTGTMARIALGAGVLGGVVSLVSSVWMGRQITNISMAFMFAGLFVFGLVALRVKPMARGNGLPVLAGFWWPSLVILAYVFPQVTRVLIPEVPAWLSFSLFSAMSVSLAWLGHVLQSDAQMADPATATISAGRRS